MESASEPPDSDLAEGLSLPALMTRHSPTGSGMPKRRRDSMRPSTAYAPGDVSHEGSPEEDLKKRLRGWQVETLKRKLSDQGECITGLRKAELVERLAKYGEGIFASPTQRIAPAGPVPKHAVHDGEVTMPLPPATTEQKTKRGGARAGAGRKKKTPGTPSPSTTPRCSLSEIIGIPNVAPQVRKGKRIAGNPQRLSSNSSLSSAAGSSISPRLLVLRHDTPIERDANGLDMATPSSESFTDYTPYPFQHHLHQQ